MKTLSVEVYSGPINDEQARRSYFDMHPDRAVEWAEATHICGWRLCDPNSIGTFYENYTLCKEADLERVFRLMVLQSVKQVEDLWVEERV